MKKRNGFTLVELLAVIVVLALIMVIAVPSVLKVMNSARRQSFALYVEKVVTAVQTQYLYDAASGSIAGRGFYVYDIEQDLDLSTTGSYQGYVVVDAKNVDAPQYYISMHDGNYMIRNYNITTNKMPDADNTAIETYASGVYSEKTAGAACVGAKADSCKTREGYNVDMPTTNNNG